MIAAVFGFASGGWELCECQYGIVVDIVSRLQRTLRGAQLPHLPFTTSQSAQLPVVEAFKRLVCRDIFPRSEKKYKNIYIVYMYNQSENIRGKQNKISVIRARQFRDVY